MKAGLTTSSLAHIAVLGFGIVSLAAPKPLEVPDVEALPVDIIPFEELTKTMQGAKDAELGKTPAPKPTTALPTTQPAVNIGETKTDIKADAPEVENTPPVEKVVAPSAESPPAEPETDIAMLLKEKPPLDTEEPAEEAFEKLPEKVATPKERPDRTTAKNDQKKQEDATEKAVLDKARASAGGAKRSTQEASLGTRKSNNAGKLSQNELDALRNALQQCFTVGDLTGHDDAATMRARVTFKLTRSGAIDGLVRARVTGTSGATRAVFARRVKNAVQECAPYSLPQDKYDTWADVVVNFSLADML